MSTLREIVEYMEPRDAEATLIGVVAIIRSIDQQEAATLDGIAGPYKKLLEKYGPSPQQVLEVIKNCPELMELEVPDRTIFDIVHSND